MIRAACILVAALVLASCDKKPAHYYVLCEGKDYNGWVLVGTEYEEGYLIACTYQSPDKQQTYTSRCRANGCD